MNFTFGITTDYSDMNRIEQIKTSIRDMKINNYEILIIGNLKRDNEFDTEYVYFNEEEKPKWVTRKKNILASNAKYENVVIFHDYFLFDLEWYNNFLVFGDDWDVCSNKQLLITGNRHFTDWVCWDSPIFPRYTCLNYDDWSHTRYMYQSGGYMIVKKDFMQKCPMNENMTWGNAEDVEWSLRMREIAKWKCNGKSVVKHNKRHRDA